MCDMATDTHARTHARTDTHTRQSYNNLELWDQ